MCSLLKWHRSHTSSNTPFTSLRLVLRVVYYMGLAPILSVTLRQLVSNYYSILLNGPRSHISSTFPFLVSRLVLRASLLKGPRSMLRVMLRLLVFD
jgi:hypothetical protein